METTVATKPSQAHETHLPTEVEQEEEDKTMMDVTFVLEESGVTATVEVPCEADVAAAKEVACTALAVSPASVEMRIGTQVLEGTCRLQDTAFDAGVQVVLASTRLANIKCPAEYSEDVQHLSLSRCGTLCVFWKRSGRVATVGGFDTETFDTVFSFEVDFQAVAAPAISQCKTLYYVPCRTYFLKLALPDGEVLRKVDGTSNAVFSCGSVLLSQDDDGVSVYDEDLTLLRSLSHEGWWDVAVSDCGGWVITSSASWENVRLWDVNTGEAVACVQFGGCALSRRASVFAVRDECSVQLYDWSGAALRSLNVGDGREVKGMQFTPCGKYLVVKVGVAVYTRIYDEDGSNEEHDGFEGRLHQYDVATMSCVRVIPHTYVQSFAISPCSRVVVFECEGKSDTPAVIVTRHLYPYNSE